LLKNLSGGPESQELLGIAALAMHESKLPGIRSLLPALVLLGSGNVAVAQEPGIQPQEEEKIEPIILDRRGDPGDLPDADEGFDDLVYDEEAGTYRLIERDSVAGPEEQLTEREAQVQELQRLFDLYREALDNRDYLEADTLAKRVVELSIKLNGLDSHDSAKALTNLGIAQHNNGDYEAALRNFIASIDIVERIDDNLSPALVNPLQGLAATQAAMGRPDLARQSYRRAVHVTHVNDGPHNRGQVDILESLAELNISQGDFDEAVDIQEHIFAIQSRKIEPDTIELIPALEKRAQWQHRLQRFHRERITWREIIDILEDHYGDDSLELIPALTNLGKSYLFVNPADFEYGPEVSAASGETYLKRATRIAMEHPDTDWETVEQSLLALGDFYILSGRPNRATQTYGDAWKLLSAGGTPEQLRARRDHLEEVHVLQRVYPPRYYNTDGDESGRPPPDAFETGTVSFRYNVTSSGRVSDVELLETQPREITDFSPVVGRALRRMVYRPRMVDGELTYTTDLVYTHEFYYRPEDLPSPAEAEPAVEVADESTR
jgi:tetratricopeptide (TPR) repeat protein